MLFESEIGKTVDGDANATFPGTWFLILSYYERSIK
jgi:hypothetical protein